MFRILLVIAMLFVSLNSFAGIPTKSEPQHDSVSAASGYAKESHISGDPKERAIIVTDLCKFTGRNQHDKFFALLAEHQLRLERIYQEINCGELLGESLLHVVVNKIAGSITTGEKIMGYFALLKKKYPDADVAAIFNQPYSKGTILDVVLSRKDYYGDGAPEKIKRNLERMETLLRELGASTSSP